MKILQYFLYKNDPYLNGLEKNLNLHKSDFYLRKNNFSYEDNKDFQYILELRNMLEECYQKFMEFDINKDELIQIVKNSLIKILNGCMEGDKNEFNESLVQQETKLILKKIIIIITKMIFLKNDNYFFYLNQTIFFL